MAPFGDSLRRLRDRVFLSEDARRKAAIHTVPPLPPSPPASAVIAAPAPSATACSALFQRLPGEVRQRILVAAFGDRLLHVHLSLERPVLHKYRKSSKSSKSREGHAGHPARYTFDDAARPFWRWRSSCCHSHCFHHESWRWREPRQSDQFREKDCCVSGEGCGHPGAPETCFIGAAGWLRTCRQAYLEGYTVLYRTNTVRLHGTFMFAHLTDLFPRLSLDSLTLVSLCWDMGWSREYPRRLRLGDHPEEYSFLEGLDQLLVRLPLTIPNVKSLHLSLHGVFGAAGEQWTAYGTRCEVVFQQTEALLHRVLAQVLKLPKLTDFRLALPRSMFMPWLQEVLDITLQFEEAIWAELPAEWLRRDIPADLMASDEKRAAIDSFWVLLGASDLPPLTIRCFC